MDFRQQLILEKAQEIQYKIDKISKKRKEYKHKKALEYCKKICNNFRKEEI